MKKTILLLCLSALAFGARAQIFDQYKRNLGKAEKRATEAIQRGADFVLDPIETVPRKKTTRLAVSAQTNWGKDHLLPAALEQRIRAECTYKVTVKVADTGQPDHAALKAGQLPGANYTSSQSVNDGHGHSTHVCGIIAAQEIGLARALVEKGLLEHKAIKILDDNGSGSFTWVQAAIAAERPDDMARTAAGGFVVWNGSFGGGTAIVEGVEAEIKKSTDAGAVFCFAAGNTGQAGVNYPGCGKYSIACASLDQNLARSSYSTMGAEVWAAMPGRNINSTYKGNSWAVLSGTSMATPFLTAATAIAFSKWGPRLKARGLDGVRAYLAWCAKDLGAPGRDTEYGWGIDLVSNVLDRDPANTPGIPVEPPPPPPNTGLKSVTPLPVALKGSFNVYWDNLATSATSAGEARTFKTGGRGSRARNRSLALKTTPVNFEISAPSSASAGETAKKLEKATADYFTNRGFMLPAGQDESWAAYWAAYFLEMGLQQGALKWPVTVTKVTLTGSDGQKIGLTDLRHWPVK